MEDGGGCAEQLEYRYRAGELHGESVCGAISIRRVFNILSRRVGQLMSAHGCRLVDSWPRRGSRQSTSASFTLGLRTSGQREGYERGRGKFV